jgi:hypothetical protein
MVTTLIPGHFPVKPSQRPHCYICATVSKRLTDDHIPPRGFFPVERRENLIVAPLCESCHQKLNDDDEAMRLWLSSSVDASASGKWIAKHEAMPSLLKKPKLLAQVKKHIRHTFVFENGQFRDADEITMPQARVKPFVRRITKGLLYTFYPDYDYFRDSLIVKPTTLKAFKDVLPLLAADQRGADVFELWHSLAVDTRSSGIWIYRFYKSACFVCMHSHSAAWQEATPAGYKEFHKLPQYL